MAESVPRPDGTGGLTIPQLDELDTGSNAQEIAAFKNRRMKRRPTLAKQYQSIAQQRRIRRLSIGQNTPQLLIPPEVTHRKPQKDSGEQQDDSESLTTTNGVAEADTNPIYRLESMKSAHAYEAHTINWKEDQEEIEMKKRQEKVLRSAGTFRKHMYNLIESMFFNAFILVVILLNTAILCALTFNMVVVRVGWYFTFLDYIFLVIYFIEMCLKIYVWRLDYFKEQWNIIDFMIVQTNIADFLVSTLVGNSVQILSFITIFRAMRALRALRVLRTVRFLKSLQVIMTTCLQSVQSMGAITMLISLFLYMFAVIGRGLYNEVDPGRFGNLGSAMLTLFQLLTLDDWFYIFTDAMDKDPQYWHIILYLILYIATEYFIFLNLFVAVLVDNFQLTIEAAAERETERRAIIKAADDKDEDELAKQERLQMKSFSSESVVKIRKTVADYYTDEREYSTIDKEYLGHLLRLMASLEYNGHVLQNQQGTLDKMIDMVQVPMDDA
ncbi:cation channel sperm-associated protein 1-like [Amphiura filiformis]|uniref:cation channel sperm-associated protein 1-like n=1 Tax=Amphiura filiformis TaxID=82378 RepID=UPI003B210A44